MKRQVVYSSRNPYTGLPQWWHNISKSDILSAREKLQLMEILRRNPYAYHHDDGLRCSIGWINYGDGRIRTLIHYLMLGDPSNSEQALVQRQYISINLREARECSK